MPAGSTFGITPPQGTAFTLVTAAVVLLPILISGGLLWAIWSARAGAITIAEGSLRISGGPYGRTIPLSDLIPDQALATNLKADRDHALSWRTNGIGLPGFQSGWFKLKNGEKALAFVTDPTKVAYIPTRQGYAVVVSVDDPSALIASLKTAR